MFWGIRFNKFFRANRFTVGLVEILEPPGRRTGIIFLHFAIFCIYSQILQILQTQLNLFNPESQYPLEPLVLQRFHFFRGIRHSDSK